MDKNLFIANRKNLAEKLENNSMLVMFAGEAPYKSADEKYPFTPNRNYYYLTGIDREKIIFVMSKIDDKVSEMLFIERFDPVMARWVGAVMSQEEAKEASGIETVKYLDEFEGYVGTMFNRMGIDNIYLDLERQEFNIAMTPAQNFAGDIVRKYPYIRINNVYNHVTSLRVIKSEQEIEAIRKAISITKDGIYGMMKHAKPGMMEYEVEAFFNYTLKKNGVTDFAFKTIAAAGKNATVLHYVDNNSKAEDGSLILFDLGAQWNYYNADISRTIPMNGKFTDRQKDVYNVVLKAQKEVEKAAKPGISLMELNEICKKVLAEGCKELGLIKEDSELIKYYFHGVGHFLGADTHDVGGRGIKLQPGMIITNEPGLYIEEEAIGIRIEDDLLITEDGCENLSKDIMKEVEDIEAFMNEKKSECCHK